MSLHKLFAVHLSCDTQSNTSLLLCIHRMQSALLCKDIHTQCPCQYSTAVMAWPVSSQRSLCCRDGFCCSVLCMPRGGCQLLLEPHDLSCCSFGHPTGKAFQLSSWRKGKLSKCITPVLSAVSPNLALSVEIANRI